MEGRTVDIERLAIGFDALDRPGTGAKPQVLDGVAQFFIAFGRQFGHAHAFLHIRVIALQLLELQGMPGQWLDQLAKTLIVTVQTVIAGVELLALSVVDAQIERIAVDLLVTLCSPQAEVLESLQTLETRKTAHHRQDPRVKGAHQVPRLLETDPAAPERKQFDQLVDEVLARLAGEGHHRHRTQLEAQVMAQQQDAQHQRGRLACAGTGDHRGGWRVAEDHFPLCGAGLGMGRQQPGDICLHALLQLGAQRQAPIVEQQVIDIRWTVFSRARVADQQDLPTLLQPLELAFPVAVIDPGTVTAAKTVGLAMQPRRPMLCVQAGQAVTEESGEQSLDQRHLGQGAKFRRKIGGVLRHAD
ncbi:hypothetical protein D3C78_778010 [compost metagenome]